MPVYSLSSIVLGCIVVSVLRYTKEKVKARIWAKTFDKRAKKFLKRYDTERGGQEALVKSILGELERKNHTSDPVQTAVQTTPVQAPVQPPQAAPVFQIPPIPPIPQMPPHATQV